MICLLLAVKNKTCKRNDVKERSLLLMALPNEHQLTFDQAPRRKTQNWNHKGSYNNRPEEEIQANMALMAFLDSEMILVLKQLTYKRSVLYNFTEDQIINIENMKFFFPGEIAYLIRSVGNKDIRSGLLRMNLKRLTRKGMVFEV
ncbi:hypothetical protein Tco_0164011 [Tanacetum coccineum]